jgi:hypothetical protein
MPTFKNLNDLFAYAQKQAASVLKNEVAQEVKQQMHEVIEEVTYEQYEPLQYIRTHKLSDVANMEVTVIDDDTIEIINTRHDGETDVARVVATGIGYSWLNSPIAQARLERNFYEDTYNFLKYNGRHVKAMKEGLKKRGFNVK